MIPDEDAVEAMVLGGAFLGGGGGGSLEEGRKLGSAAIRLGKPDIVPIDSLPGESLLATVSAVGAPAAREKLVRQEDYIRAVRLLQERTGERIAGLISSENGALSTVNGLIQSAALGLPVVDAPCNGRAHPTGIMGSMALGELPGFISRQAAVGGNAETGRHLELCVDAPLARADALVRQAAVEAGGLVAVARNPVQAGYVRTHGARGAISMAVQLGRLLMANRSAGGETVARKLALAIGGEIEGCGQVARLELETRGGYDLGRLTVEDLDLTFWNEYMTLERSGERLATFPDLICTLDAADGTPRTSASLSSGAWVIVVSVPRKNLILGAGMRLPAADRVVEEVVKAQKQKQTG